MVRQGTEAEERSDEDIPPARDQPEPDRKGKIRGTPKDTPEKSVSWESGVYLAHNCNVG